MFDKKKFANIIKQISDTYENQRKFSTLSGINRTYLSQYMNMKLDEPPKPKILEKLASASHEITTYSELMTVCGYTDSNSLSTSYLEELYEQLESNFLNMLSSFKLSPNEREIYDDLCIIVPIRNFDGLNRDIIHKRLLPYFDNMDYLSNASKEKIINKLILFIEYSNQTNNLKEKIFSQKNCTSYKNDIISNNTNFYMCPVYGKISAGQPNWAEECLNGYLPIDPNLMGIVNPEECFFLKVDGESMNKVIRNGAYALIRKQDSVDDGEIAVVLVNGFDATLKKFTKQGDFIFLEPMSTDETIKRQIYDKTTSIKIIGKYIGKFEIN